MNNNATSYSEYQCFARCPRKHHYNYRLRLQPKRTPLALGDGAISHQLLMRGYLEMREGLDIIDGVKDEAYQLCVADETRMMFDDELLEYEDVVQECETRVLSYFEQHDDPWEILHVEETFVIMVDNEVVSFTPDLVVRTPDGNVWVVDHKNVKTIPDELPFGDMQAALYIAGVKAVYPETVGFIWNYLRKKTPTQPRLVKDGSRVSDINRIDTTYEILYKFCEENGLLNLESHRARLIELQNSAKFFRRMEYLISDDFEQNLVEDITELSQAMRSGVKYRVFSKSPLDGCDRCSYNVVCKADLQGGATDQLIQEFYEPLDLSHRDYEREDA